MFSLRNRNLLIASKNDTDAYTFFNNYRSYNSDRITLEEIIHKLDNIPGLSRYYSVYIFSTTQFLSKFLTSQLLLNLYKIIQPGGNIFFHVTLENHDGDTEISQIEQASLFSGYINSRLLKKEEVEQSFVLQYAIQRPTWDLGATTSIDDGALIDDSLLLDQKEYVPLGVDTADCSTKPKACSNCTCGRKQLEDKYGADEAKKRLETGAERSSCGNCYLGDAFRCSSCPYRGQPAFKPGRDVIELDTTENDLSFPVIDEEVSLNDLTLVQHKAC